MADGTKIQWTDATWNPITGCSVVTPGCTNCYAMRLAGTRLKHHWSRTGLTDASKAGPVWNGQVRFNEGWLDQPLRWRRPRMVFVCAHGDLFHENIPDVWIDRVFAVMALAPAHTFQVLTKRAERMREYVTRLARSVDPLERAAREIGYSFNWEGHALLRWPISGVWLGVSAERQAEADERIPLLNDTPAAVRFVSMEPLLEQIYWPDFRIGIDWIICGGESGPNARPMDPNWARYLRDQCQEAGVSFFMKQMSKKAPIPADLLIRQFPESAA